MGDGSVDEMEAGWLYDRRSFVQDSPCAGFRLVTLPPGVFDRLHSIDLQPDLSFNHLVGLTWEDLIFDGAWAHLVDTQGQTEASDDLEMAELSEAPIELSAMVAALETRTATLEGSVAALETRTATLESSVAASSKLIMALETRIDRLEEAD